jgi:pyruvate formate lyase activating enzyme
MRDGLVFDVQRFSVHDGPGIRTTIFFKGCPLRCPWCQNPESLRPHAEIAFYADRCRGTGDCVAACSRRAVQRGAERILREQCDACGLCIPACPFGALQKVGRSVPLDALFDEVLRDRPFYASSGGGVTLSGGEPTMQMEFAGAFAQRCRESDLSVGIQTCGAFRWEAFASYLPLFEFIHFDLKLINPQAHRSIIGAENHTILANAGRLLEAGSAVLFRMPVIPGYTDTKENLRDVATFLHEHRARKIHLLPYHPMGESKLPRLGFPIPPLFSEGNVDGSSTTASASEFFRAEGLEVTS